MACAQYARPPNPSATSNRPDSGIFAPAATPLPRALSCSVPLPSPMRSKRHRRGVSGSSLRRLATWSKEAQQFRHGLLDAGYAEGRDVVIEWRSANGDFDQIHRLAADLVQRKVDVIVVDGTPAARAALQATSTIPIVMALVEIGPAFSAVSRARAQALYVIGDPFLFTHRRTLL